MSQAVAGTAPRRLTTAICMVGVAQSVERRAVDPETRSSNLPSHPKICTGWPACSKANQRQQGHLVDAQLYP